MPCFTFQNIERPRMQASDLLCACVRFCLFLFSFLFSFFFWKTNSPWQTWCAARTTWQRRRHSCPWSPWRCLGQHAGGYCSRRWCHRHLEPAQRWTMASNCFHFIDATRKKKKKKKKEKEGEGRGEQTKERGELAKPSLFLSILLFRHVSFFGLIIC